MDQGFIFCIQNALKLTYTSVCKIKQFSGVMPLYPVKRGWGWEGRREWVAMGRTKFGWKLTPMVGGVGNSRYRRLEVTSWKRVPTSAVDDACKLIWITELCEKTWLQIAVFEP